MQKTVHKYPLELCDSQLIMMPVGAKILDIQEQGGVACIWALVNPEADIIGRTFETFGTGQPIITEEGENKRYIGTYLKYSIATELHVFELVGA